MNTMTAPLLEIGSRVKWQETFDSHGGVGNDTVWRYGEVVRVHDDQIGLVIRLNNSDIEIVVPCHKLHLDDTWIGDPSGLPDAVVVEQSFMERSGMVGETAKDSNPKDAVGIAKAYMSTVPQPVLWEVGVAMLEGSLKYGRHNYRKAGVRASVYYDAMKRHLDSWWEGEDLDPETSDDPEMQIHHISKLIAGAVVLRDAMMQEMWADDRPPRVKDRGWLQKLNRMAKALLEKYPPEKRKAPFTNEEHGPC